MSAADGEKRKTLEKWAFRGACPSSFMAGAFHGVSEGGAPGTTAALALLNDQVKKGGVMVSSYVGGLLGHAPVMKVSRFSCEKTIARKGRIPAPIHSFKRRRKPRKTKSGEWTHFRVGIAS